MDKIEAAAALAGVDQAQDRLAQKMADCPPWRHAAFGLLMATLVGSAGMPLRVQWVCLAAALVMIALLFVHDRRRYGVFVNGFRRGATLPVALTLLGVTLVVMMSEIHAREAGLSLLTRLGLAAVEFVIAVIASIKFQAVFLRDLRRGRR